MKKQLFVRNIQSHGFCEKFNAQSVARTKCAHATTHVPVFQNECLCLKSAGNSAPWMITAEPRIPVQRSCRCRKLFLSGCREHEPEVMEALKEVQPRSQGT